MDNEKITIFSEPEKIDAIINTRLQQFPRKGAKQNSRNVGWTEEELQLIDNVIFDYICKQGLSRESTAQQISSRWDVTLQTARRYVKEAIERFANSFDDDNEKLRKVWMERCETILTDAIESRQKDSALKALDLMAKSMGLYKDNINIGGGDTPIKFDFS